MLTMRLSNNRVQSNLNCRQKQSVKNIKISKPSLDFNVLLDTVVVRRSATEQQLHGYNFDLIWNDRRHRRCPRRKSRQV